MKNWLFFTNQPKNDNEQTKYCLDQIQLHNRLKFVHNAQKQNYCQNIQENTFFKIPSDKKLEAKDEKNNSSSWIKIFADCKNIMKYLFLSDEK